MTQALDKTQNSFYFDYAATTPCDPKTLEYMLPYFSQKFGNPSSSHAKAWEAKGAISVAQDQVAHLLGCHSSHVHFTSGATESVNWALKGFFDNLQIHKQIELKNCSVISTSFEHECSLQTLNYLKLKGLNVELLKPSQKGLISPDQLESAIIDLKNKNTPVKLVSIIWGHNELGSLQDIYALGSVCKKHQIHFHVDATQVIGKVLINLKEDPIDFLSLSAHKLYGPKGTGALIFDPQQFSLTPLIHGGGQQNNQRSGTLNTPGIVGLGWAAKFAQDKLKENLDKLLCYKNKVIEGLTQLDGIEFLTPSDPKESLPHILFFGFKKWPTNISPADLLKNVYFSQQSACHGQAFQKPIILNHLGISDIVPNSLMRISFSHLTTQNEIEELIRLIKRTYEEALLMI